MQHKSGRPIVSGRWSQQSTIVGAARKTEGSTGPGQGVDRNHRVVVGHHRTEPDCRRTHRGVRHTALEELGCHIQIVVEVGGHRTARGFHRTGLDYRRSPMGAAGRRRAVGRRRRGSRRLVDEVGRMGAVDRRRNVERVVAVGYTDLEAGTVLGSSRPELDRPHLHWSHQTLP